MSSPHNPFEIVKARGAFSRPAGRFEQLHHLPESDGWDIPEDEVVLRTEVVTEQPRSVITRNTSPDIPFDRSLNPYRGCEHGCIYCYARPSHAYLGLSPGLDFETRITAKPNAASMLAREIGRKSYKVAPLALGTNTDPYQPIEAKLSIMPSVLQVLRDWNHPVTLVTRGKLVLRDLDLWAELAASFQTTIGISITTLNPGLARAMEPRAPSPAIRLEMIRQLSRAGIPVRIMVAPVIPVLTEPELESIMIAARESGATYASMIPLRLPHEVSPLFRDWLERHCPDMAAHIMNRVQAMRGGRDNDPRFGHRFKGEGVEARLLQQRFKLAKKRLHYLEGQPLLDCSRFAEPAGSQRQLSLF